MWGDNSRAEMTLELRAVSSASDTSYGVSKYAMGKSILVEIYLCFHCIIPGYSWLYSPLSEGGEMVIS